MRCVRHDVHVDVDAPAEFFDWLDRTEAKARRRISGVFDNLGILCLAYRAPVRSGNRISVDLLVSAWRQHGRRRTVRR